MVGTVGDLGGFNVLFGPNRNRSLEEKKDQGVEPKGEHFRRSRYCSLQDGREASSLANSHKSHTLGNLAF